MIVPFTNLPPGGRNALPSDCREEIPDRLLLLAPWLSLLLCIALMGMNTANGVIPHASEVSAETTDHTALFFFTDPDVSLISGPSHWSTRAAQAWFGDENTPHAVSSIPDEWHDGTEAPHDPNAHWLVRDALIDHRLEKFADDFACPDLFSSSPNRIGPEQIDKSSSSDALDDWMAQAPIADFAQKTAKELPGGNMIFVLVRQCLEWEMRKMLQERSARHWSECFDLLPRVCQSPDPVLQGAPTMHELLCMTSRSCVVPVSVQSLWSLWFCYFWDSYATSTVIRIATDSTDHRA